MPNSPYPRHRTFSELEQGLPAVLEAPAEVGVLDLIVRRPAEDQREVLEVGELDLREGLVGDNWIRRPSGSTPDGSANPDAQLNLICTRSLALVTPERSFWPLAGDQLVVNLDLTGANVPPGTQLSIGAEALIEVTAKPHTGCDKFAERFGIDATRFFSTKRGLELNLRGVCAKVLRPGTIRRGDVVRRL